MRGWLVLALATSGGCADPTSEGLRIEVPVRPGDRAFVLGIERNGAELFVAARDLGAEGVVEPVVMDLGSGDTIDFTALFYDRPLAEVGLTDGRLRPDPEARGERPLPDPDRVEQLRLVDGSPTGWQPRDTPPRALASFRLAAPTCPVLVGRLISVGIAPVLTFALALPPHWVLLGTRAHQPEDRRVLFVSAEGTSFAQAGLPASLTSGYREDDGRIWLGGEGGLVMAATLEARPEPSLRMVAGGTVSSGEEVIDLAGPPNGVPDERFALTASTNASETWGAFERFDGASWQQVGPRRNTPHDAAWVAPGYGLFASFFRNGELLGIRDGMEIAEVVDSLVLGNVVRVERIPGLGLAAGTTGSEVHLRREGRSEWRRLYSATTEGITALHAYRGGIAFMAGRTLFVWRPDGEVCGPYGVPGVSASAVTGMTVLDHDIIVPVIDGEEPGLTERFVVWFAPASG